MLRIAAVATLLLLATSLADDAFSSSTTDKAGSSSTTPTPSEEQKLNQTNASLNVDSADGNSTTKEEPSSGAAGLSVPALIFLVVG